jgi:hypothetical protein
VVGHLAELCGPASLLESLGGLSGDASDELEVLVEVQNRQPGQLGEGGDEHVGDGRRAVLALASVESVVVLSRR